MRNFLLSITDNPEASVAKDRVNAMTGAQVQKILPKDFVLWNRSQH